MNKYTLVNEKQLPESELQIEAEVSYEILAKHRSATLKKLASQISVPGFRVGHVPENIVIQKIGELGILEEAAETAIDEALFEMFREKKLKVAGEPKVTITKIAQNNPLCFTVVFSVIPEVKLPDYKKIASEINAEKPEEIAVSEKELEDFILNVRKSYAENSVGKNGNETKEEKVLPPLDEEFVKKLGSFKDVEDFKIKIKENLLHDKEHKALEKKRLKLSEAILAKTEVTAPKALIESELAKLLARFHDDITNMGMKFEDYLSHIKKSEDDLRKEWRPDAEKRGKLQLMLSEIASKEKIEAPAETVAAEVKHITETYKEVEPARAKAYVAMMLTNEEVFKFLENLK